MPESSAGYLQICSGSLVTSLLEPTLQKGCQALLPQLESRLKAQAQQLAEWTEHQGEDRLTPNDGHSC